MWQCTELLTTTLQGKVLRNYSEVGKLIEKLITDKQPTHSVPLDGGVAPQIRMKRQIKLPERFKHFIVE